MKPNLLSRLAMIAGIAAASLVSSLLISFSGASLDEPAAPPRLGLPLVSGSTP